MSYQTGSSTITNYFWHQKNARDTSQVLQDPPGSPSRPTHALHCMCTVLYGGPQRRPTVHRKVNSVTGRVPARSNRQTEPFGNFCTHQTHKNTRWGPPVTPTGTLRAPVLDPTGGGVHGPRRGHHGCTSVSFGVMSGPIVLIWVRLPFHVGWR